MPPKQPSPLAADRKFIQRIRRHDSTEWASPPKAPVESPKKTPGSGERLVAARALAKPRSRSPPHEPRTLRYAPPPPPDASSRLPWLAIVLGLAARHFCSLHPYSGEATPPRFGDYEAHRHWMEVTVHLPLAEWYSHDVEYWGLDYPPLMAYVEYGLGRVSKLLDPASVALGASRGYEAPGHRAFMRATALVLDALVCVSALAALAFRFEPRPRRRAALLAAALASPALVLVDHGHFQYNSLPLGLTLWCAYFVDARRPLTAALCFTLALHAKQTALYYAPAVFCELLGRALRGGAAFSGSGAATPAAASRRVAALGVVVVATTAALWLPLVRAGAAGAALRRCFPVERGLFEDKVANAWYAAHVVLRVRDRLPPATLVPLAAVATCAAAFGPGLVRCRRLAKGGPASLSGFLWALHASGLAFFLFSYHVHEKGILVPLAPLLPLALAEPNYVGAFSVAAAATMLPLLWFEGLHVAYGALQALHALVLSAGPAAPTRALWFAAALAPLHVVPALAPPPPRYPDLYPALTALVGAGGFGLAFLYAAYRTSGAGKAKAV